MIIWAAIIVVATLAAMTSGKIPPVLALAAGLALAGLTRVAPAEVLFSGLSNTGVITVGGMLVIAKGVVHTGIVTRLMARLLATVSTARQALRRLIGPIGVMSALINTTPIVAMLVPASKELEQSRGVSARELLLPITHVTTLAGSITLIGTSSNLLIAGIAGDNNVTMTMLSFAPVALPVALVGALVIYLTAPHLLRGTAPSDMPTRDWRVEIPVSDRAIAQGRVAAEIGLASNREYELEQILRRGEPAELGAPIESGDLMVFAATEAGVTALWKSPRFGQGPQRLYEVSVGSGETGRLGDIEQDENIRVIAAQTTVPLRETALVPGATCFVTSDSSTAWQKSSSISLWQDAAGRAPQPGKTWIAVAVLVGVIVSASFGLAPVSIVALSGAVLMILTGVITPRSAVRALDWNVLFILAGSVGLGSLVVSSGLADVLANGLRFLAFGKVFLVVVVFAVGTTILTNLVSNAAAASILTPIGISISADLGIDPVLVLALIGTCISFTFINPFSHQSNLMVMRPGGYTNAAFARFGAPLIAAGLLSVIAVAYLLIRL